MIAMNMSCSTEAQQALTPFILRQTRRRAFTVSQPTDQTQEYAQQRQWPSANCSRARPKYSWQRAH